MTEEYQDMVIELTQEFAYDEKLFSTLYEIDMQNAYETLQRCGFNNDNLRYITERDLENIYPERENFAFRAELREKLMSWKIKKFPEDATTASCNSKVLEWIKSQCSSPTSTHNSFQGSTSTLKISSVPIVVSEVLQNTEIGRGVTRFYAEHNVLDADQRKKLINCIVNYFYDAKTTKYLIPSHAQIESIAAQISSTFPSENRNIYYISRKDGKKSNPSGILFNRFNNLNRKRENLINKLEEEISEKRQRLPTPEADQAASLKCKMHHMSCDDNEAMELWVETYPLRSQELKLSSFETILENWPFYKQSGGEKFIDYDFSLIFPDCKIALFVAWPNLETSLIKYFSKSLKDKRYIERFNFINKETIDRSSKACILVMLINAVLKPTSKSATKTSNGKTITQKATINDGITSSFVHIKTINDLQSAREKKVEKSLLNKEKVQPFMVVVGPDISELKEFYISFNTSILKFTSFVQALDILFKVYHVFNLSYPKESILMWTFFQKDIYKIQTPFDIMSSCVAEFTQNLSIHTKI